MRTSAVLATRLAKDSLVSAYAEMLAYERQYSPHTQTAYLHNILVSKELLTIEDWSGLTIQQVKRLVALSKQSGLSARSISLRLSALRQFCDFLIEQFNLGNIDDYDCLYNEYTGDDLICNNIQQILYKHLQWVGRYLSTCMLNSWMGC